MAATKEISSFVRKFVNLWHSGCDAKLSLNCQNGKIKIQLSLETGHQHPPAPPKPPRRPGPSRLRRRARRAEEHARASAAGAAASSSAQVSSAVQAAEETPKANEVAVQATVDPPTTTEAAAQAGTSSPRQKDVAVQACQTQVHANAAVQAAAAVHPAQLPHTVLDLVCQDEDYFHLLRKKQEIETKETLEKRSKERQDDLENFMKMIQ